MPPLRLIRHHKIPYANILGLVVFCACKKGILSFYDSTGILPFQANDVAWNAAKEVWNDLESFIIARGFLLAYIIAVKVIAREAENNFLNNAGFPCKLWKDYANAATGIKRATVVST
jgi:hypothetical protein